MRVLLVAGLGPGVKNQDLLAGSSFDPHAPAATARGVRPYDLTRLYVRDGNRHYPLLRADDPAQAPPWDPALPDARSRHVPHLTTLTLQAILRRAPVDELVTWPTERIWQGAGTAPGGPFDAVLLSTTFIWERRSLARAIRWVTDRYPEATLVLGGQYSNLKYRQVLAAHPAVTLIVRGDAEVALPGLLRALQGRGALDDVPNLVWADPDSGTVRATQLAYADLEAEPSPAVQGHAPVLPYESMRGCPFRCRFCSFPAASPRWRFKSARKIRDDFARYRDSNGTRYVKALDSTFTVPRHRLRELLPLLAGVGVRWEAYTRANLIQDRRTVDALAAAGCASLAIGFESMSDEVLGFMDKRVTARSNRALLGLLAGSGIEHRASFMVGYPGETPEHFERTRRFLVEEYHGRFSLYVFSLSDETMPVWQDAQRFQLRVHDPDDPDQGWEHAGMTHHTARALQRETLREVRWRNDRAVLNLWQAPYQVPLVPSRSSADNLRVEKLVERLGMLAVDVPDPSKASATQAALLAQLCRYGIHARDRTG